MTYQVSAPKTLTESMDPKACPGTLEMRDPAQAKSARFISNAYARPITKPIRAGATATGVVEYSIAEDSRTADVQISSTCGDIDRVGEKALFGGKIPELRKENTPEEVDGKAITRDHLRLRVDQVRTDLDAYTYAALVEICARETLSAEQQRTSLALDSWALTTSRNRTVAANDDWRGLRPLYPYGRLRKGSCASGWLAFTVDEGEKPFEIGYDDERVNEEWRVAKGGLTTTPTPSPTQQSPTRPRPPTRPPRTTPPPTTRPPTTQSPTTQPPTTQPPSTPPPTTRRPSITPS